MNKFQDNLAKKLYSNGVKLNIGKGGKVRPNIDVIKTFSQKEKDVSTIYDKISIDTGQIIKEIEKIPFDRSSRVLTHVFSKLAVDEVAKAYWRDYFGEYGKELTREISKSAMKVSDLIEWREWFERSYGIKSAAVKIIDNITRR